MRRALPVVLTLVVLAGCSGLGGQGTPTPTTESDGATATVTNGTERLATTDRTTDGTATGAPNDSNASAVAVKADAVAAMDAVETYRVVGNQTSRVAGNLERTVVTTTEGAFDRTAREARVNRSQTAAGQSVDRRLFVVDGTLYQYSPAFSRQYDSNWVSIDLSGNGSTAWEAFDTLTRQRALLNASDVVLDGTATLDGTDVYVLEAEPSPDRYEDLGFGSTSANLSVSNVSATYYVDAETDRPVASTTRLNATRTVQGRTVSVEQRIELRFEGYGDPVSVELPDAARDTAVEIGNRTTTGTPN